MTTSKPQSQPLQRRSGLRRPSFPASPTSPGQAFFRRNGRSVDLHSPQDAFSAGLSFDSPSLDLDIPSPTFDIAAISPGLVGHVPSSNPNTSPPDRASADYGKSRPKLDTDLPRPATSGSVPSLSSSFRSSRPSLPTEGVSYGSSQVPSRYRDDVHRRADSSDDGPGPVMYTAVSPNIPSDRGLGDDENGPRLQNKKSRLNFSNLNPMSILARRRSSQNTNKLDEPIINVPKLQVPAMKDFDPSIRGSFVHDFSAPRNRRSNNENSPRPGPAPSPHYPRRPSEHSAAVLTPNSAGPASAHSPIFKEHFQDDRNAIQPTYTAYLHAANLQAPDADSLPTFARRLPLQIPEDHFADEQAVHDVDVEEQEIQSRPPEPLLPPPPPPAPQRTPSPKHEIPPQISSLPKHMTSTSSRFSYIGQQGSIAEEKLLEQRHKEHALKFPANPRQSVAASDIDDYDFDDDGLEEAIPGVNADYEDGGLFDNDNVPIRNIDVMSSTTRLPQQPLPSFNQFDDDYGEDDIFGDGEIEVRNIDIATSYLRKDDFSRTQPEAVDDFSRHDSSASKGRESQSRTSDVSHLGLNRDALQSFHFTPQSMTFSPTSTHHPSEPTPRDSQGLAIGLAESEDLSKHNPALRIRDSAEQSPDNLIYQGLGISTDQPSIGQRQPSTRSQQTFDDSELYFDDGEFGGDFAQGDTFDESLLDGENAHIRDIPAENARKYQEALDRSQGNHDQVKLVHEDVTEPNHQFDSSALVNKRSSVGPQVNLTEDNLAAYHDALALAATRAAANGKFERSVSFNQVSDDDTDSPFHQQAAPQSRGSRYSNNYNFESSGVSDDDPPFDSDDMDDDAMIAAANAEALENDDDGFYGSEFGFYARAYGKSSDDMVSGGFFASRGSNGIKRSHSGKNNFQEPSLTPITERSEWSTRNSVASLPLHTGIPSAHSHPSPGLAHLLQQDSPVAEDEMSLKALMRLRGRTFGSSSSIGSLSDAHTGGSPRAQISSYKFPPIADPKHTTRMSSSSPTPAYLSTTTTIPSHNTSYGASIPESSDEDLDPDPDLDDGTNNPTMTQNTPARKLSEPLLQNLSISTSIPPSTNANDSLPSSPIIPRKQGSNHSRNSSGADSVSYEKVKDGRWVLERRRTGDDGELEVIAREYLAGTRI